MNADHKRILNSIFGFNNWQTVPHHRQMVSMMRYAEALLQNERVFYQFAGLMGSLPYLRAAAMNASRFSRGTPRFRSQPDARM